MSMTSRNKTKRSVALAVAALAFIMWKVDAQLCTISPSRKERTAGVAVVTDPSCASMTGAGCMSSICRYCRLEGAVGYTNLLWCSQLSSVATPPPVTPTPTTATPWPTTTAPPPTTTAPPPQTSAPTPRPTTTAPSLTTVPTAPAWTPRPTTMAPAPTTTPPAVAPTTAPPVTTTPRPTTVTPTTSSPASGSPVIALQCTYSVSGGDTAAGIVAISDVSCCQGGLGCVSDVCRICRQVYTLQSAHLLSCADLLINNGEDIGFVAISVVIDNSGLPGSISSPIPTSTLATITLPSTTTTPSTTQPTNSAPVTTSLPSTDPCASLVPSGDQNVGISAITDASCSGGGLGCFSTTCRYCQTTLTAQSSHLLTCTSLASTSLSVQAASSGWGDSWYRARSLETEAPAWAVALAASGCTALIIATALSLRSRAAPTSHVQVPTNQP